MIKVESESKDTHRETAQRERGRGGGEREREREREREKKKKKKKKKKKRKSENFYTDTYIVTQKDKCIDTWRITNMPGDRVTNNLRNIQKDRLQKHM